MKVADVHMREVCEMTSTHEVLLQQDKNGVSLQSTVLQSKQVNISQC